VGLLRVATCKHLKERCFGRLVRLICIFLLLAEQCHCDSGHDASELDWSISNEGTAKTRESTGGAFKEEVVGLLEAVTAETAAALERHEFGKV
jgi:hypothetical protein